MKTCRSCNEDKPLDCFYAHKETADRKQSYCKDCSKKRAREYARAHPEITRKNVRKGWVKHKYGLSAQEHERLMSLGDNCAICGSETKLSIDHDHATGAVRGRLCHSCNLRLGGVVGEDVVWMASAIKYLTSPPFQAG
jgi:hypothetical protein